MAFPLVYSFDSVVECSAADGDTVSVTVMEEGRPTSLSFICHYVSLILTFICHSVSLIHIHVSLCEPHSYSYVTM